MKTNITRTFLFLISLSITTGIQAAATNGICAVPAAADSAVVSPSRENVKSIIRTDPVPLRPDDPMVPLDPAPLDPNTPFVPKDSIPYEPVFPNPNTSSTNPYSVGTPEIASSVSNSGAAVYDLKIHVPDGGPLTPQIGLSYNSQFAGYGLAGYGCNITGISAITRGGHDLFHDDYQKGVTYTSSDNLYIDGKRLILQSGVSGQNGATYTVEGAPFTKVVVHGNYQNNSTTTWFEVTTNTGMTYEYGRSGNSCISFKNKKGYSRIASWYVNKATDRYSNYITYNYAVSNLSIRPVTITYGINSVKSRGIVNKIEFSYKSLGSNARPFAIEDQQGLTDQCLSSITTLGNNNVYR